MGRLINRKQIGFSQTELNSYIWLKPRYLCNLPSVP
jgi:hypothetical protein